MGLSSSQSSSNTDHQQNRELILSRRFLPLFLSQFLEAFNINLYKNALFILVTFQIAENIQMNANLLINMGGALLILPFIVFSTIAGQIADKFEKTKLVQIIKFIEMILVALIGIGLSAHSMWLTFIVLFLLGTHGTFFGPIKYAILPNLLKEKELIQGNAWIEAGTFLAILLGTLLGGIFILQTNGKFIIVVILAISAIIGWLCSLYIPSTVASAPLLKLNWNIFSTTKEIVQHAFKNQRIFRSILGISWLWLIGVTFLALFPLFVKNILHANNYVVTLFLIIFSLGIGIGSFICSRLMKEELQTGYVPFACLGITLFVVDLYFASHYWPLHPGLHLLTVPEFLSHFSGWRISFDLLLTAICAGIYVVPLYTLLQIVSEENYRARVLACNNIFNALFMVAAAAVTYWLLKRGITEEKIFLLVGLVNAAVAIYIAKLIPEHSIKVFLRWLFKTAYRTKIAGLEHFKEAGDRVVIVANHTSFLDAALIAAFLPGKFIFAVNTQISKLWWIKPFLLLVEAYPLDPTNPMAIKSLIKLIKENKKCIIFPEGRITMTGTLMKIYEGPGVVADKSNAKLLPIRIDGAQYTPFTYLRGKVRIRFFPKIKLTIFPAETLDIPSDLIGKKRRHYIGLALYSFMTQMVFKSSDYKITLFQSLLNASSAHGGSHIIAEDTNFQPINYKKLIFYSFVLGRTLSKTTLPGEIIGLLLPNMVSTVITFFGLQAFGRVPAMLNYSSGAKNVVSSCRCAKIRKVYTSRLFVEKARIEPLIAALLENGILIEYLEDVKKDISIATKIIAKISSSFPNLYYEHISKDINKDLSRHTPSNTKLAERPAVVLFTSGSEGTPKAVVLSHINIQANRFQLASVIDFGPTDKVFNALPIFHAFGLTGGMLLPISFGIKMFLYPSPLHYRIIPDMVYFTDATIMFGTDTFLKAYGNFAHPYDFYSMRYVFAGAEKLKESTQRLWADKFGLRVFEGYGATETSPVLSINTSMHYKFGTVGRILPGIRHKLESVPGVLNGGQLVVSGPNIMLGYYLHQNPGVLVPPEEGYYRTGDIVNINADGFVSILGRVKRFAKIAGEMVSLSSVEEYISQLWPHFNHAVVAIEDEKKGEQLVLVTEFIEADRESISAYAQKQGITELSVPKNIFPIAKLPLLSTGKTDYVTVKELVIAKFLL